MQYYRQWPAPYVPYHIDVTPTEIPLGHAAEGAARDTEPHQLVRGRTPTGRRRRGAAWPASKDETNWQPLSGRCSTQQARNSCPPWFLAAHKSVGGAPRLVVATPDRVLILQEMLVRPALALTACERVRTWNEILYV